MKTVSSVVSILYFFAVMICSGKFQLLEGVVAESPVLSWRKPILIPGNTHIKPRNIPVHVVVSHCKHNLGWINRSISLLHVKKITIISKCGQQIVGAPSPAEVRVLPNVGRCDHSYVYYILHELNATEGVVLFMKDTNHIHNLRDSKGLGVNVRKPFLWMIQESSGPSQFACRQYADPTVGMANEVIYKYLLKFNFSTYNMSLHRKYNYTSLQTEPFSMYPTMNSWIDALGMKLQQPITQVCYGGVFAVNVKRLLDIDRTVWEKLERSLSRGDNILEGHYMERAWAGMLSLVPPKYNVTHLVQRNETLCLTSNVCGYRGNIVINATKLRKRRLCLGVPKSKVLNSIKKCWI